MGWYQWQLFVVVGFGWASDNFWPVITSLIFTVSTLPDHDCVAPSSSMDSPLNAQEIICTDVQIACEKRVQPR